ncbi:Major royal jelly protein [Chitinophaga ginsengisegetis]|uniref:Major royal jelly protein n=1 Tax=Chitinophaga ginsengisegetis TaxID=393003 RepID=A0A1T5N641_9BACT|nr:L-dopachrome tautomerase-related protein [Chitinophaga ginsengisegetis]SKC95669.1 Major royal jelly protein [Chitinophaga ginsengisegetis]
MIKQFVYGLLLAALLQSGIQPAAAQSTGKLEVAASFDRERPGNVAVSPSGRVFITMSDATVSPYKVKEVLPDGSVADFPDTTWTRNPQGYSYKGINATIGIQVTADNVLWVLDLGNRKAIPAQAPKLVAWDIETRKLLHVYPIPDAVLKPSSFLQDFVIDEKRHTAVIADMSMGGLILPAAPAFVVVDLQTGYARRILENHPSFQPVDEDVVINGHAVSHVFPDGSVLNPRYPLNPISIDPKMEWIYFGALGGRSIYRIAAAALSNQALSDSALSGKITYYAPKPKSDGFKVGDGGILFVTDVENSAVVMATPAGYSTLVKDTILISWPDGLAIAPNGYLYLVSDQLHKRPFWNQGKEESKPPFYLLRIKIDKP